MIPTLDSDWHSGLRPGGIRPYVCENIGQLVRFEPLPNISAMSSLAAPLTHILQLPFISCPSYQTQTSANETIHHFQIAAIGHLDTCQHQLWSLSSNEQLSVQWYNNEQTKQTYISVKIANIPGIHYLYQLKLLDQIWWYKIIWGEWLLREWSLEDTLLLSGFS